MTILLLTGFLTCAVFFTYFLGVETGRETAARDIENDDWFASADPNAGRHAAWIARRRPDHG